MSVQPKVWDWFNWFGAMFEPGDATITVPPQSVFVIESVMGNIQGDVNAPYHLTIAETASVIVGVSESALLPTWINWQGQCVCSQGQDLTMFLGTGGARLEWVVSGRAYAQL